MHFVPINPSLPGVVPLPPDESHIKAEHFGEASHGQQPRIDLSLCPNVQLAISLLLPISVHYSVESHTIVTPEKLQQVFRTSNGDGTRGEGKRTVPITGRAY